ncbi:hypothetical protein DQ239_19805 [Blastococcus sp. TF02-09]|nr:hypothetical protein DQ239_19805 [Blastococcus sp. TF02-9]
MRAGDEDRQRVVEQLGTHFAAGRLTIDEFDDRVVRAQAAVHLDELPALTADLPGDPSPQQRTRPERSATRIPPVLVLLVVLLLAWSVAATVIYRVPPLFGLFLLFVFIRHMRWSWRW